MLTRLALVNSCGFFRADKAMLNLRKAIAIMLVIVQFYPLGKSMKTIGLIGGMSWESSLFYYR